MDQGNRQRVLPWLLLSAAVALSACGGGGSPGGSASGSSSSGGSSSSSGAVALCPNTPQADAVFGQSGTTANQANAGGDASASTLSSPVGGAAIAGNTLYVADTFNNRVLGYSPVPGSGNAGAASLVLGQPDFASTAPGTAAASGTAVKFRFPSRVSSGDSGHLVVADSGNNRVLIWKALPTSAGLAPDVVLGQADLNGNSANQSSASPSAATLSNPTSAFIGNGKLLVADKGNNRVLIWNSIPGVSGTPADIELGQDASTSNGTVDCTANSGAAGYCFATNVAAIDQFPSGARTYTLAMNGPTDVWTDGTHLLVADTNNHRVLYWNGVPNVNDKLADGIIGASQFGATSLNGGSGIQALHSPDAVTADSVNVYVADTVNNRVLEFANYLGAPGFGPAASALFGQADYTHITANDPDQNNQIGDQRNNPVTSGVTAATFYLPQGLLVSGGQIYVTDTANNRMLRFAVSSAVNGSDPVVPCTP